MIQARLPVRAIAARGGRELGLGAVRIATTLGGVARHDRSDARQGRGHLRIIAVTPTYLPTHRRGAEVSLHATLTRLAHRGHEVRVLVERDQGPSVVDGIDVVRGAGRRAALEHASWADVVCGQLASRWCAAVLAIRARRPFVYFVHIGNAARMSQYGRPDLTVFSSAAIQLEQHWMRHSLVLHPPIDEESYRTSPGDALTMVNLTKPKGASLFVALAEQMPERRFLGVTGYDRNEVDRTLPANVVLLTHVDDMREVYRRTRVLLVPSVYESYGRVGLEAAASGIPTIAHPSLGMREAMGAAALWADRNDLAAWTAHIETLDHASVYERRSTIARERFLSLDPEREIDQFQQELVDLVARQER